MAPNVYDKPSAHTDYAPAQNSWSVGDIVRVSRGDGSFRVWQVSAVLLGALNEENMIELSTLDKSEQRGKTALVPEALLNAANIV